MVCLCAIVAVDPCGVIGKEGRLPWHFPEELAWFKKQTEGHVVLLGRRTFESLGGVLPHREHWVLTKGGGGDRRKDPRVVYVSSLLEVRAKILENAQENGERKVWVCGGSEVYRQLLPYCGELYLTHILRRFSGDEYFPSDNNAFVKKEVLFSCQDFEVCLYENQEVRELETLGDKSEGRS